jgi:hypothetical protein
MDFSGIAKRNRADRICELGCRCLFIFHPDCHEADRALLALSTTELFVQFCFTSEIIEGDRVSDGDKEEHKEAK